MFFLVQPLVDNEALTFVAYFISYSLNSRGIAMPLLLHNGAALARFATNTAHAPIKKEG